MIWCIVTEKIKRGDEVTITPNDIMELIQKVEKLVGSLDEKLSEVRHRIDGLLMLPESEDA